MDDKLDVGKRQFLTGAVTIGGAALGASVTVDALAPREAAAQLLETGIDPNSVLAKIKEGNVLRVGYAQTPLWFYRNPKTGDLEGVYKELVDIFANDLEITVEFVEVTFANATVGLRKGDYDLFGSSLVYTVPRALVANYVGPLWTKGSLAIVRKEDADKYKSIADLNQPDVTFSVNAGASEEQRMPQLFPKANFKAVTGQQAMAAEPVRTGRATVYVTGDSDAKAFARRNSSWAHIVDPEHPFDKRPNTWTIRYGDDQWKHFLDFWAQYAKVNGIVQKLYDEYLSELT